MEKLGLKIFAIWSRWLVDGLKDAPEVRGTRFGHNFTLWPSPFLKIDFEHPSEKKCIVGKKMHRVGKKMHHEFFVSSHAA